MKFKKKFKLIKLYPGSPELGTTVKEGSHSYTSDTFDDDYFTKESIENFPEFWKQTLK